MTQMKIKYLGDLKTECVHDSGAKIKTDAPRDNQGEGKEFSPTDLFAASLGSCMITLMGIYAKKFGVKLENLNADVEKTMSTTVKRRVSKLIVRIHSSSLPNKIEREKLENAALECPVHLSIHPDVIVEVDFLWGAS